MTKKDSLIERKTWKILARARHQWHTNWRANNFSANGNTRGRVKEKAFMMLYKTLT